MAAVANPSSQPAAAAAAGAGASASAGAALQLPATHQRVHLAAFGDLKVVTEPVPKALQPGSAVVRVIATDVAANAAALFGGKVPYKPAPPMTPGGTCFGQVVAVADDVVGGPRAGAYVVVNRIFRQNEAALLVGAFSLTPPHVPAGAKQSELWKNGSWAQYALLPAAALIAVPDAVVKSTPPHVILRAITLSIAHGALVTRGRFAAGQTVLVGGATGIHGLATVLLALAFGAEAVYVMGRSAAKLKALTALSARVKAVVTGDGSDEKALAAGMAVVGKSADVYVDFYPYLQTDALTLAGVNALRTGGVAALGGGVQAVLKLSYAQFLLQQLTITGTLMYPDDTIPLVLRLLGSGAIDTKPYAANEFVGLEHIHSAMDAATAGKEDAFKTVVIYPNGKPAVAAL